MSRIDSFAREFVYGSSGQVALSTAAVNIDVRGYSALAVIPTTTSATVTHSRVAAANSTAHGADETTEAAGAWDTDVRGHFYRIELSSGTGTAYKCA